MKPQISFSKPFIADNADYVNQNIFLLQILK